MARILQDCQHVQFSGPTGGGLRSRPTVMAMMTVLLPTLLHNSVEYAWHVLQLPLSRSLC